MSDRLMAARVHNIAPFLQFLGVLAASLFSVQLHGAVGKLPGEFAVSPSGAASYTIPIEVPAGANGQRPGIALEYSSGAGQRLAGYGWGLGGFSTIYRCSATVATNGAYRGVQFDNADRLCLDGQQLMLQSGTYLQSGSVYRPELHDYEIVTAQGSGGSTATSFEVKLRDGTIMRYGNDGDSAIQAPNSSPAAISVWALNEIEDTVGNRILFTYQSFNGGAEYVPTAVQWSVNSATQGRYQLVFEYDTQAITNDDRGGYTYGSSWQSTKRLKTIRYRLYDSGSFNDVHTYDLVYTDQAINGTGTGRSQLYSVTKCGFISGGGGSNCLQPTTFEWSLGQSGWSSYVSSNDATEFKDAQIGDFNGDGISDVFVPVEGDWHILLGQASGGFLTIDTGFGVNTSSLNPARVVDHDGDGKYELLARSTDTGGGYKAISFDQGTVVVDDIVAGNMIGGNPAKVQYPDINGDGLPDLVQNTGNGNYVLQWKLNLGGGGLGPVAGYLVMSSYASGFISYGTSVLDINGDGKEDLLVAGVSSTGVTPRDLILYRVNANNDFVEHFRRPISDAALPEVLDINGDGLPDIIYPVQLTGAPDSVWCLRVNTGKDFRPQTCTGIPVTENESYFSYDKFVAVTDYDSDGRSDFLQLEGSTWRLYRSNGVGFDSPVVISGFGNTESYIVAADFNGDGLSDLLYVRNNQWARRLHTGPAVDLLEEITDGFGNEHIVTYESLVASDSYLRDEAVEDLSPAIQLVEGPTLVVTSVSSSDGIGGIFSRDYSYKNGRYNRLGRGFLGFESVTVTDGRSGLRHTTEYNQFFPYTGALAVATLRHPVGNNNKLSETVYDYEEHQSGGATESATFVYLDSSISSDFELDGSLVRRTVKDMTPSGFGYNFTHGAPAKVVSTVTSDVTRWIGSEWRTEVTYSYQGGSVASARNCLALVASLVSEKTNDMGTSESREIASSYNNDCQLTSQTVGAVGAPNSERLKTDTYYLGGRVDHIVRNDAGSGLAERRVNIGWDSWGYRPVSRTSVIANQDDPVEHTGWNYALGLPASVTNARGLIMSFEYDDFGREQEKNLPGQPKTTTTRTTCTSCNFDHSVYVVEISREDGATSQSYYDSYDRQVGLARLLNDGDVSRQETRYNAKGEVVSQDIPYISPATAHAVVYEYDLVGRRTKASRASYELSGGLDAVTTWTYTSDLRLEIKDPNNQTTTYSMDPEGQLRTVLDPSWLGMQYTYHPFGELSTVSEVVYWAPSQLRSFEYNGLGQKVRSTDVNAGELKFDVNVFGEVTAIIDFRTGSPQPRTTWQYDQLGRRTLQVDIPEGNVQTVWKYGQNYGANDFGLLKSVEGPGTDYNFSEAYAYDSNGHPDSVTTTIEGQEFFTDYYYNSLGQLKNVLYPTSLPGLRSHFQYDYVNGFVDKITDINGVLPTSDIYELVDTDALGREIYTIYGSAAETEIDYDDASTLVRTIRTGQSVSTPTIQNMEYVWDGKGNLISRKDNNQSGLTETFHYDNVDRLDYAELSLPSLHTSIDLSYMPNGNISTKSGVGTYVYGENGAGPHALTSVTESVPGTGRPMQYQYDMHGNMTCRGTHADNCTGGEKIDWYSFNKPQTIEFAVSALVTASSTFKYGPDRERRYQERTANSVAESVVRYVGPHFEYEYDAVADRSIWRSRVLVNGRVIYIREQFAQSNSCGEVEITETNGYFLHHDHQSSVVALTHDTISGGDPQYSFDPYGKRRDLNWENDDDDSQMDVNRVTQLGYTGHEHLDNVRLVHMNGRVQDPIIGRFLSPDPVLASLSDTQSHNGYNYVRNSPLSHIDPTGYRLSASGIRGDVDTWKSRGSGGGGGFGGRRRESSDSEVIAGWAVQIGETSYFVPNEVFQSLAAASGIDIRGNEAVQGPSTTLVGNYSHLESVTATASPIKGGGQSFSFAAGVLRSNVSFGSNLTISTMANTKTGAHKYVILGKMCDAGKSGCDQSFADYYFREDANKKDIPLNFFSSDEGDGVRELLGVFPIEHSEFLDRNMSRNTAIHPHPLTGDVTTQVFFKSNDGVYYEITGAGCCNLPVINNMLGILIFGPKVGIAVQRYGF